jgi:hypothetical protein
MGPVQNLGHGVSHPYGGLTFKRCNVRAVDVECTLSVKWGYWTVQNGTVG